MATLALPLCANAAGGVPISSRGLILRLEDGKLVVWQWIIEYPSHKGYACFLAPLLKGFKLRDYYLKLELYVVRPYPRGGVWWPYKCNGPAVYGKSLSEVVELRRVRGLVLINVTYWPKESRGVTVSYEGEAPLTWEDGLATLTFPLLPADREDVYIQVPPHMELVNVTLGGGEAALKGAGQGPPYAPIGYKYYHIRVSLKAPGELEVLLTKSRGGGP